VWNRNKETPVTQLWEASQKRRYQRIALEVEVIVVTNGAMLPGRTQDISESGMAAIIPVELHEGAEVELQIKLPRGAQTVNAIVRNRNVYRHGFEFVQPLAGIFRNDAATGDLYLEQGNRELQK
jgi:c-di-GMP-binding flagellar brake protein YcgR